MNLGILSKIIGPDKIGGWVRAGVGAAFVAAVARWPVLGAYLAPDVQTQLAAALAALVVGAWSQLTKTDDAKMKMTEALPDVANIVVKPTATDGVAAAAADPTRTKVVTQ